MCNCIYTLVSTGQHWSEIITPANECHTCVYYLGLYLENLEF